MTAVLRSMLPPTDIAAAKVLAEGSESVAPTVNMESKDSKESKDPPVSQDTTAMPLATESQESHDVP